MAEVERHPNDVVAIGRRQLRAVIEARERGLSSRRATLFVRPHGRAEGLRGRDGQRQPEGQLKTHWRHDARGGKFLEQLAYGRASHAARRRPGSGSWRPTARCSTAPTMAESVKATGGHTYPRLAHVGDRTGLS